MYVPAPYVPMTLGDWIITKLVLMIPMVGLVMLFVWAFGDGTHPSKKTFCQSVLVLALCGFGLALVILFLFGGMAFLVAALNKNS